MNYANAGRPPGIKSRLAGLAAALLPVFPPNTLDWRPFFLDIWEGSGDVNFDAMLAHINPTPGTVVIRSGQGHPTYGTRMSFYRDPQYEANVLKAVAFELPWQQYHVFLPNYKDTKYMVEYARQRMEEVGHFPRALWWDHQLKNNQSADTINGRLQEVMAWSAELIPEVFVQGIYVAKWVYDRYAAFKLWMNDYFFWWAKWRNTQESPGVSQVDLPIGMDLARVIQQQTTSHGDGRLFGYPTHRADYNRALLLLSEYLQLLDVEHNPEPPPNGDLAEQVSANRHAITDLREKVGELEEFKDYILGYQE